MVAQYEKDKYNRTLINQLAAILMFNIIISDVLMEIIFIYRYTFGELHELICHLEFFVRPGSVMITIFILDAMCIVRYIFIFHLKNPTVAQDDFWRLFLVIWMSSCTIVTHVVFVLSSGNYPNFFYICLGKYPARQHEFIDQNNWALIGLLIFSLLAHFYVGVRYLIYRCIEQQQSTGSFSQQQEVTFVKVNQQSLGRFATNISAILYVAIISVVPNRINNADIEIFDSYPECIWIHAFHLYLPPLNQIFSIAVICAKSPPLRNYLRRAISELVQRCQNTFYNL